MKQSLPLKPKKLLLKHKPTPSYAKSSATPLFAKPKQCSLQSPKPKQENLRVKSTAINTPKLNKLAPLMIQQTNREAGELEAGHKRNCTILKRNVSNRGMLTQKKEKVINLKPGGLTAKAVGGPNKNHKKTTSSGMMNIIRANFRNSIVRRDTIQRSYKPESRIVIRNKLHKALTTNFAITPKQLMPASLLSPKTTLDSYRIGKSLGKGGFGKVHLAIHKLSNKFIAIKFTLKKLMEDKARKSRIANEIEIWAQLKHPNVIRLYETFETENHLLYVQEVCLAGNLLDYVKKRRKLKESAARFVMRQILDALHYLHSKRILHRDVKLDNILLTSQGTVKLCDFGVSRTIRPDTAVLDNSGTPAYIPPEVVLKLPVSCAADVWSAGIVMYAMLHGVTPFKAKNLNELGRDIVSGNIFLDTHISESARDLLKGMLNVDAGKRLTIIQVLKHRWFRDYKEIDLFTQEEKKRIADEFSIERFTENSSWAIIGDDSANANIEKNITTRSVIFAPFNTTSLENKNLEISIEESTLKLGPMVRETDYEYEKNNNNEVDNEVYKGHSLDSSIEIPQTQSPDSEWQGLAPQIPGEETLNAGVIELMCRKYGYAKEYLAECLRRSVKNHATTTYYLLLN